jgi:hypothetical protein
MRAKPPPAAMHQLVTGARRKSRGPQQPPPPAGSPPAQQRRESRTPAVRPAAASLPLLPGFGAVCALCVCVHTSLLPCSYVSQRRRQLRAAAAAVAAAGKATSGGSSVAQGVMSSRFGSPGPAEIKEAPKICAPSACINVSIGLDGAGSRQRVRWLQHGAAKQQAGCTVLCCADW